MQTLRKNIAGIIASGIAWPLVHYLIGAIRFGVGNESTSFVRALIDFGLFGLIAGWIFFFFRDRALISRQKSFAVWAYIIALPFAFIGTLAGGLFLPGMLGAVFGGSMPLLIACWLGSLIGGLSGAG